MSTSSKYVKYLFCECVNIMHYNRFTGKGVWVEETDPQRTVQDYTDEDLNLMSTMTVCDLHRGDEKTGVGTHAY